MSRKGCPNKSTERVRRAIALFAEANVDKTFAWIEEIANGIPDKNIKGRFIVPPDPKGAFNCMLSMLEYHVPKLQRTEVTGKDGEQLTIRGILESIETSNIPKQVDQVDDGGVYEQLMTHGIIEVEHQDI